MAYERVVCIKYNNNFITGLFYLGEGGGTNFYVK